MTKPSVPSPATAQPLVPPLVPEACQTLPPRSKPPRKTKPAERKIRQEMVLLRTVVGMRAAEIAKELQLNVATVRKDLAEARRSDLVVAARDQILGLVPKAIATLEAHLDDGDKDVALIVLEGLGIIGKHMQVSVTASQQPGVESFEVFRARVLRTKETGNTTGAEGSRERAALLGPIVDAEVETPGGEAPRQGYLPEEAVPVRG